MKVGPENASLQAKAYREGVAARVGHDLVLNVTRWEATVELAPNGTISAIELTADPRSLEVHEALGGVKPLTDKERGDVRRNIDRDVLRGQPIAFRSTAARLLSDGGVLAVDGDLTMAGRTRPVSARLDLAGDGHLTGLVTVIQSAWGIKPYRGLMGALRVRDEVEVVIDAFLPRR